MQSVSKQKLLNHRRRRYVDILRRMQSVFQIALVLHHKIDGSSLKKYSTICKQYYKCGICDRFVDKKFLRKGKKHACTDLWCRICKRIFPPDTNVTLNPCKWNDTMTIATEIRTIVSVTFSSTWKPGKKRVSTNPLSASP